MLREDSVFDISLEQLGQRGFMTAREIQWLKYFAGGNVPTLDAKCEPGISPGEQLAAAL
jgi:hypothetical protein